MAAGFKTATVRSGDVPATQTNFPTYVDLDRLGITTLAEAQSIRVYADEAKTVEWAREIVSVDEMHVKVPSLTSTVDIYVDWDGVRSDYATTATYGAEAVWGGQGYLGVYHGVKDDSTSNGNSATDEGGAVSGDTTGLIGKATELNGSSEYLKAPAATRPDGNIYAVFMHIKRSRTGVGERFFGHTQGGSTGVLLSTRASPANAVQGAKIGVAASVVESSGGALGSTSPYYAIVYVADTNGGFLYVDGTLVDSVTSTAIFKGYNSWIGIGARNNNNSPQEYFGGSIGEVRIADSEGFDSDWISTEYNNQNDESAFWGTWTDAGGGGGGGAAQAARRGAVMMM